MDSFITRERAMTTTLRLCVCRGSVWCVFRGNKGSWRTQKENNFQCISIWLKEHLLKKSRNFPTKNGGVYPFSWFLFVGKYFVWKAKTSNCRFPWGLNFPNNNRNGKASFSLTFCSQQANTERIFSGKSGKINQILCIITKFNLRFYYLFEW